MKNLFFIAAIVFGMIGCKTKKIESGSADYMLLNETTWEVVALDKKPLEESQNKPVITFNTSEMRISGSGGCNRISGVINAQSGSDRISFGPTIATRMACINMEAEITFLNLLEKVACFKIENNKLTLYDSNRNELMSFVQKN